VPADRFIKQRKNAWQRLEELLNMLDHASLRRLNREEVRELGRIYRRTASDLAIARAESRDPMFPDSDRNLTNTDGDKLAGVVTKLEKVERIEIKDPWGNPLAYFHWRGYSKEQVYQLGEERPEGSQPRVNAWRGKDGQYINKKTFQIFSAGPDGIYGNADDIGNFEVPKAKE
jgi:hypothetical protein